MKQNIIMIVILIGLFIFGLLIYDFSDELDKEITNNSWYIYDNNQIKVMNFKDNNFSFITLEDNKTINEFKTCKTYRYNRSINVVKLNCSIESNKIYISSINKDELKISINGEEKNLFSSLEKVKELKFKSENNLSDDDYEDLLNVDYSLFNNINVKDINVLIKEKNDNYLAFINDKINYDNAFNYLALEKNAKNNRIYVINVSKLTQEEIDYLSEINSNFTNKKEDYLKNQIDIYMVGNKKINFSDSIDIKTINEAKKYKIGN